MFVLGLKKLFRLFKINKFYLLFNVFLGLEKFSKKQKMAISLAA
jgi:hypothetical protein